MIWRGGTVKIMNKHIKCTYGDVTLDLTFPDKITFLYGDSGKGKTYLAKALSKQDMSVILFDYTYDTPKKIKVIKDFIRGNEGFLIVIDNFDLLADDEIRELIYNDDNNMFLLIGRDPHLLHLSAHNFVDIEIKDRVIRFKRKFK